MKGRRALLRVLLFALAAIVGIVGMLLTEGAWNVAFFLLAGLPLVAGTWWRFTARASGRR